MKKYMFIKDNVGQKVTKNNKEINYGCYPVILHLVK